MFEERAQTNIFLMASLPSDLKKIEVAHVEFAKWLPKLLAEPPYIAGRDEGGDLVIQTAAGTVFSTFSVAGTMYAPVGRMIFWERAREGFELPPRAVFDLHIRPDAAISMGAHDRDWQYDGEGWPGLANKLGNEIILALMHEHSR